MRDEEALKVEVVKTQAAHRAAWNALRNEQGPTYRPAKHVETKEVSAQVSDDAIDAVLEALGLDGTVGTITIEPGGTVRVVVPFGWSQPE